MTSHRNRLCVTSFTRGMRPTVYVSLLHTQDRSSTMNQNVPFIWRASYRNEAASPETFLEIAHERARQYLRKNLSSMSVHKAV
jgi:hypothetical protein